MLASCLWAHSNQVEEPGFEFSSNCTTLPPGGALETRYRPKGRVTSLSSKWPLIWATDRQLSLAISGEDPAAVKQSLSQDSHTPSPLEVGGENPYEKRIPNLLLATPASSNLSGCLGGETPQDTSLSSRSARSLLLSRMQPHVLVTRDREWMQEAKVLHYPLSEQTLLQQKLLCPVEKRMGQGVSWLGLLSTDPMHRHPVCSSQGEGEKGFCRPAWDPWLPETLRSSLECMQPAPQPCRPQEQTAHPRLTSP